MQRISASVVKLELPSHTLPPFAHTNSFVVHNQGVGVLVDAGFYEEASLRLIKDALATLNVSFLKALLLTHTHPDHIEGIALLRGAYPDLPIYVHAHEFMQVEAFGNIKILNEARNFMVGDTLIQSVFTPGHSPGHLSFYLPDESLAIVGDLLAGKGSTWIGKPEGSMNDYLASLERIRALKLTHLAAGHGDTMLDPYNKLNEVRQHRLARLEQVLSAFEGHKTRLLIDIRKHVYPDVPELMTAIADSSLLALLEKLMLDRKIMHLGDDELGPYMLSI